MITQPTAIASAYDRSIRDLLLASAARNADAAALIASDGTVLSYGGLISRVDAMVAQLRAAGIMPGDRVALILPNGIDAAVGFLAAACAGVACPINPAGHRSDFDYAFADMGVRLIVTDRAVDSPALVAARAAGIPALAFTDVEPAASSLGSRGPGGSDIALILHTSGTTARPKMVPLTHANLLASAHNIASRLMLVPGDRCLNVMPLFHIHGLVGALLATLAAGGSIVCSAGFVSPEFFAQLRRHRPTWYTAVPTMHQAILARAATEAMPAPLRFVRSSSAALPPPTARALETLFGAPVIEAYGMTEAAHQMCSNPLVRGAQRYGSVGPSAGPDVVILDERGERLADGRVGEVAIRGANVTAGYLGDPAANSAAFAGEWFRTGDLGRFDADGYLFLEGRIKELINRGGEKISPREIDDVLMNHPAIIQAVAFPLPDERLGEDVGAAVVLQPHAQVDERELLQYAAATLADWKIPRRIAIVTELPKSATGKIVRHALAELLAPQLLARPLDDSTAESAAFESGLAQIWCEVLHISSVDSSADFLALGGDSVLAGQVVARVRARFGRELSILAFFDGPTLRSMAIAIAESPVSASTEFEAPDAMTMRA